MGLHATQCLVCLSLSFSFIHLFIVLMACRPPGVWLEATSREVIYCVELLYLLFQEDNIVPMTGAGLVPQM